MSFIFTHCGKLGDFFLCWPIAAWYTQHYGEKVHFVLPHDFMDFQKVEALVLKQPFTERVSFVPHIIKHFKLGGQPYRFNPADYGFPGKYINLGLRSPPDKCISAFCSEEHGFEYDLDYVMSGIQPCDPSAGRICYMDRSETGQLENLLRSLGLHHNPAWLRLLYEAELETNLGLAKAAQRVVTTTTGFVIACQLANIPATVVYFDDWKDSLEQYRKLYFLPRSAPQIDLVYAGDFSHYLGQRL